MVYPTKILMVLLLKLDYHKTNNSAQKQASTSPETSSSTSSLDRHKDLQEHHPNVPLQEPRLLFSYIGCQLTNITQSSVYFSMSCERWDYLHAQLFHTKLGSTVPSAGSCCCPQLQMNVQYVASSIVQHVPCATAIERTAA